jgi:hypothetical protein
MALRRPGTSAGTGGGAVARNALPGGSCANNDAFGVFVLGVVGLGGRVQKESAVPHARLGYIHLLTSFCSHGRSPRKQSSSRPADRKYKITDAS